MGGQSGREAKAERGRGCCGARCSLSSRVSSGSEVRFEVSMAAKIDSIADTE